MTDAVPHSPLPGGDVTPGPLPTPPPPGAVCTKCGSPLDANGTCVACLLRLGFDEPEAKETQAPTVFGDFEIDRREDGSLWLLGRGAMGVTYRAVDRVLHRSVALKVIGTSPEAARGLNVRERFLREARSAAALRHANVASVFQFGMLPEGGQCYYAMELVEGETLEARVRRDGPLDVATVLEIAAQVTAALHAAALRGLIHRDLKPSNLMLSTADEGTTKLEVKVIDFGLAKAAARSSSGTDLTQGGFVGTPVFASPEQLDRADVDARSDIYSLGVTLWYALTGQLPFTGDTIDEIREHPARAILPVEQLTERRVTAPVVALLRQLLALNPTKRPASARELMGKIDACRRLLPGGATSLQGRRPSPFTPLTVAVGLILLASIGLTVAWWARSAAQRRASQRAAIVEKSIAVLPFASLGGDKLNTVFADGVQDEILNDLARVSGLKVISHISVLPYRGGAPRNLRGIAAQLGVAHVVEGSVQREGDQVRVSAKLIDAHTDTLMWGEHYFGRNLSDVFAIQSEIAQAIAEQLQAKLSPGEKAALGTLPTSNPAAYDAYLQGESSFRNVEWTQEETGLRQAARQFEEATVRDPQFFLAWCQLSQVNLSLYWYNYDHTPERLARAEHAMQTARRLRPGAGETHLVAGSLLYMGHHDLPGALAELRAAARLLPNNSEVLCWLGYILRRQGRWDESIANFDQAAALDPRNADLRLVQAETDEWVFRYAEAHHALGQALAIDPQNLEYLYREAECVRLETADREPLRRWLRALPTDSERWSDTAALGHTLMAMYDGDYPAAARALTSYHLPTIADAGFMWPTKELEGWIAFSSQDQATASAVFLAARQSAADYAQEHAQDAKALIVLARIDAELGHKEAALREGQQACQMLPVSNDAIDGALVLQEMAGVYALANEPDQALATLRSIVGQPVGPSFGGLRLDYEWDPLRKDPRFEAIVAAAAPHR